MADYVNANGLPAGGVVFNGGGGGPWPPLTFAAAAVGAGAAAGTLPGAPGGLAPGGTVAAGVGTHAAVAAPAAVALGPTGGTPGLGAAWDMDRVGRAISELQGLAAAQVAGAAVGSRKDSRDKDKARDKKKKKGKHRSRSSSRKKRKKRHHRSRSRSSTSSSSKSSRSSSSSSSRKKRRPLQWRRRKRDRSVEPKELTRIEADKFKTKGDVMKLAAEYPGALAAWWLAAIHNRLTKGQQLNNTKQLRTGLTELRDLREVQTLGLAMDCINRDQLAQALDVMAQRVTAIQAAKRKGGSWDKAETVELLPGTGSAVIPAGMAGLI